MQVIYLLLLLLYYYVPSQGEKGVVWEVDGKGVGNCEETEPPRDTKGGRGGGGGGFVGLSDWIGIRRFLANDAGLREF